MGEVNVRFLIWNSILKTPPLECVRRKKNIYYLPRYCEHDLDSVQDR